MEKFPKWTFQEISFSELKKFLWHAKIASITVEIIRDRFTSALERGVSIDDNIASVKKDLRELFYINFNLPLNAEWKSQNWDNFIKSRLDRLANFKTPKEMEIFQDLFMSDSQEENIKFLESDDFFKVMYLKEWVLEIVNDFLQNDNDKIDFVRIFKGKKFSQEIFESLLDSQNFLKKLDKSWEELKFFIFGDDFIDFENSLSKIFLPWWYNRLFDEFLDKFPILDENGKIIRNHIFFKNPNYKKFFIYEEFLNLAEVYGVDNLEKICSFLNENNEIFWTRFLKVLTEIQKQNLVGFEEINIFLKKYITNNRDNINFLKKHSHIYKNPQILQIFEFFLKNKQKSFIDFLYKINENNKTMEELGILTNFEDFRFIADESIDEVILYERQISEFIPMDSKLASQWQNSIRTKSENKIREIATNRRFQYFFFKYREILQNQIYNNFSDLWKLDSQKIENPDFIETYKMWINTDYNKSQFEQILRQYLKWEFDDENELNQFKTPKNQKWIEENLDLEQRKIWFSKNEKEFLIKTKNSKNPEKNFRKIKISREQNPLNVIMMGKRVIGSCLDFASSYNKYYSTVANAIDANKAVFYLYDEENNIISRVLVTIGSDKKIARYRMYYSKMTDDELDQIFDNYIKKIAYEMKMEINWKSYLVDCIESEKWYMDFEKIIR